MEIYLDNSATTRTDAEVIDLMKKIMDEDYGNPSSMHNKGFAAEQAVRFATETFCRILKCTKEEVYYTSGGTESNNWVFFGAVPANKRSGRHILASPIEHPSVSVPLKVLSERGYEVEYLSVDASGHVDAEEVRDRMRGDTVLVSVMTVNNETGALQDIAAIGQAVKEKNPHTLFHTDAVQAFGKYRILPKKARIDLLSVSAHKLHGPKGVGLLYAGRNVKMTPFIYGGGQQRDMRSGTENVPGIAGFAKAAEKAYASLEDETARIRALRDRLLTECAATEGCLVHTKADGSFAPHILNVSFPGIRSEVMLHALEEKGIYVSAGSACSTHKNTKSPTLSAMGAGAAELDSAIRFSLSGYNTPEEIDHTVETLNALIPVLSRFVRR